MMKKKHKLQAKLEINIYLIEKFIVDQNIIPFTNFIYKTSKSVTNKR